MSLTPNRITAVVSFLVGLMFLLMALEVEATDDDPIGPGKVAVALSIAIMVLSIVLGIGRQTATSDEKSEGQRGGRSTVHLFFAYLAAGLICTSLFDVLGYIPVAFAVLLVLLFAFGNTKLPKLLAMSLFGALGYYVIFVRILGMRDPRDFLAGFL